VSLQGFTALSAGGSEAQLKQKLLLQALADGRRQAEFIANSLGLKRIALIRINQSGMTNIRQLMKAEALSFDPNEANQPISELIIELEYCLYK